ncbi:MAG: hypothetical protein IPK26_02545 [Planctomycetes bacterium]|nr:hypothetical protein [Planctomycetota bacterium]
MRLFARSPSAPASHVRVDRVTRMSILATVVLTAALTAQTSPAETPHLEAAARVFAQLSEKDQKQVLAAVQSAVATIDSPARLGLQPFIERARLPGKPRLPATTAKGQGSETAVTRTQGTLDGVPFPVGVAYQFGVGAVSPRPTQKGRAARAATEQRTAELKSLLRGHPAFADLALAGLLQTLDTDRSVDTFAHLLETWRNGAESFYEALERTAGSSEGVFHYDAMFADWQKNCVPKNHPDRRRLQSSSDLACRGFQAAFKNYWRYRSQIEALAVTLLLDANEPLPDNLRRFEDKAGDDYSMRECMVLLLAAHGGDVAATVDACVAAMPRLPEPLWQGEQDGFTALQKLFATAMPKMLALAPSTDALLQRCRGDGQELRQRSARTAWEAFQRALPGKALQQLGQFAKS